MPHTKRVFEFMEAFTLELKLRGNAPFDSMLYVGWRHDCKPWWHDTFAKLLEVKDVRILEVFPKNIGDFEQQFWEGKYQLAGTPVQGDVRQIDQLVPSYSPDVIFWDHGPEHVTWEDLKACTPKVIDRARKVVIYCGPMGEWPQGMEDGNEHEVHRNSLTVSMFNELGFETYSFGVPGQQGEGELVGFKFK